MNGHVNTGQLGWLQQFKKSVHVFIFCAWVCVVGIAFVMWFKAMPAACLSVLYKWGNWGALFYRCMCVCVCVWQVTLVICLQVRVCAVARTFIIMCFTQSYMFSSGMNNICCIYTHTFLCVHFQGFVVELQLDSVKQNQKRSIRRTLFLDSQQSSLLKTLNLTNGESSCHDAKIYLRVSHSSPPTEI